MVTRARMTGQLLLRQSEEKALQLKRFRSTLQDDNVRYLREQKLRRIREDKRRQEVQELYEQQRKLSRAFYSRPAVVQIENKLPTMDTLLNTHPNKDAIIDALNSIVTGKVVFDFGVDVSAFMRYYISRFKKPFCRSRHYELKLTPLIISALDVSGELVVRRFAKVEIQRPPLLGRSEVLNATLQHFVRGKATWDYNVSSYITGVAQHVTSNQPVAMFIAYNYEIKIRRTMLDLMLRPHLIRYYYAKIMGLPETWMETRHCGVYVNPRVSNLAEIMYNYDAPATMVRDFARHRYKAYRSVRDVMQGI